MAFTDSAPRPVLVSVDSSDHADQVVRWAALVAGAAGAPMVLATVWHPSKPNLDRATVAEEREASAVALEERTGALASDGHTVTTALLDDEGPGAVLDLAERLDASAIVTGTRRRTEVAGIRLGSFADFLLHRIHRPLMVVPEGSTAPAGITSLLLGVDPDLDDVALWPAAAIARIAAGLGASTTAVSVGHELGSEPADEWAHVIREAGVELTTRSVDARSPADALVEAATDVGAAMIVIGTRAIEGRRVMRLGGVTTRLVHRSDVPVLVVPPVRTHG